MRDLRQAVPPWGLLVGKDPTGRSVGPDVLPGIGPRIENDRWQGWTAGGPPSALTATRRAGSTLRKRPVGARESLARWSPGERIGQNLYANCAQKFRIKSTFRRRPIRHFIVRGDNDCKLIKAVCQIKSR